MNYQISCITTEQKLDIAVTNNLTNAPEGEKFMSNQWDMSYLGVCVDMAG